MNNPLKAIVIEGLIEQEDIKHQRCPDYFQLNSGLWALALGSVAFSTLSANRKDFIFNISSNLVQGDKLKNGNLSRFNVVLQQFKIGEEDEKQIIIFHTPLWFIVNQSPSEYCSFLLNEWPSSKNKRPKNILIALKILFRRLV
jgi:hypothetical protein